MTFALLTPSMLSIIRATSTCKALLKRVAVRLLVSEINPLGVVQLGVTDQIFLTVVVSDRAQDSVEVAVSSSEELARVLLAPLISVRACASFAELLLRASASRWKSPR